MVIGKTEVNIPERKAYHIDARPAFYGMAAKGGLTSAIVVALREAGVRDIDIRECQGFDCPDCEKI